LREGGARHRPQRVVRGGGSVLDDHVGGRAVEVGPARLGRAGEEDVGGTLHPAGCRRDPGTQPTTQPTTTFAHARIPSASPSWGSLQSWAASSAATSR